MSCGTIDTLLISAKLFTVALDKIQFFCYITQSNSSSKPFTKRLGYHVRRGPPPWAVSALSQTTTPPESRRESVAPRSHHAEPGNRRHRRPAHRG